MSVVIRTIIFAPILAQFIFWENSGEAFGYAASVSGLGLFASLTLIVMAGVTATHAFFEGRDGNARLRPSCTTITVTSPSEGSRQEIDDAEARPTRRLQSVQAQFAEGCGPVPLVFLWKR